MTRTPCFIGKPCWSDVFLGSRVGPTCLLVVTTGNSQDVALPLVSERVGSDLLAHPLLQEDSAASQRGLWRSCPPSTSQHVPSSTIHSSLTPPSTSVVVQVASATYVLRSSSKSNSFWAPVAGLATLSFMLTDKKVGTGALGRIHQSLRASSHHTARAAGCERARVSQCQCPVCLAASGPSVQPSVQVGGPAFTPHRKFHHVGVW